METIIIKVKDEKSKEIVKSLLSKMKSIEIVEPSYNGFVKGEYKEGEEITDFFKPEKEVDLKDIVKEARELRRKAWRL